MFSKELENLIQATLEDGILEDHEKAALVKRAEREGVDLAELEIYINSLLQKRQRELNEKKNALDEKYEKEKKEAFGRKCPNCGAQVPPLALKCECGYEFTTTKNVSSVQILSDKIEAILSQKYKHSDPDSDYYKEEVRQRYQRVKETINLFPVPNTKEDIIEFLALSTPNAKKKGGIWGSKSGRLLIGAIFCLVLACSIFYLAYKSDEALGTVIFLLSPFFLLGYALFAVNASKVNSTYIHNDLATAWRAKYDQVMMKARSLRGDTEFTQQLDYYENMLNK